MELLIMSAVKVVSLIDRQLHTDNSTPEIREGNTELFCFTEKGTGKNRTVSF
jgi:hypothetical protein